MQAGIERTAESFSESLKEITNPGVGLDTLGVSCEMLFERMRRVGDSAGQSAMWNALQEFAVTHSKLDSLVGESFGDEM